MNIFSILDLIGGLSLFLFGMSIMGQALERRAGSRLKSLLGKLTTNRMTGLMTGLGVTAVIHSVFNILCTALMIPFAGLLEKLVKKMIPDNVAHGTWRSVCENKA